MRARKSQRYGIPGFFRNHANENGHQRLVYRIIIMSALPKRAFCKASVQYGFLLEPSKRGPLTCELAA